MVDPTRCTIPSILFAVAQLGVLTQRAWGERVGVGVGGGGGGGDGGGGGGGGRDRGRVREEIGVGLGEVREY